MILYTVHKLRNNCYNLFSTRDETALLIYCPGPGRVIMFTIVLF